MRPSGRDILLGAQTEAQWQAQVLAWARRGGWKIYHINDSRTQHPASDSGFPDLVLCKPPRVLFVELKRVGGRFKPGQQEWLDALSAVTETHTAVWRPTDEREVERMLLGGR